MQAQYYLIHAHIADSLDRFLQEAGWSQSDASSSFQERVDVVEGGEGLWARDSEINSQVKCSHGARWAQLCP